MQEEFDDIRVATERVLAGAFSREDLKTGDRIAPDLAPRLWALATEMGWPGLLLPEEAEGLGLGMAAAVVVGAELGRALAPGNWAASLALAPGVADDDDLRAAVAAGEVWLAFALATRGEGGWHALVDHGASATHVLLALPGAGEALRLHLVPAGAMRITRACQPLDPGTPVSEAFVPDEALGLEIAGGERSLDAFQLFLAAQLVGIARGALGLCTDYAKTRVQFGAPIGSFQALKHRLADIAIARDASGLAVRAAAVAWDSGAPSARLDVLCAYDLASQAMDAATRACIQLHGAIGVSWEHDAHLYLKRGRCLASALPPSRAWHAPASFERMLRHYGT